MISDIKVPDTSIVRQAEELARSVSNDMLFNHVMRCYWFAELFAQQEGSTADRELMFLSATLHDLGFTDLGRGPHRFEIEGANAARRFLEERDVPNDRAWKVWDNIALHTWDINLFKDDDARLTQLGLLYDVVGVADAKLDPGDIAEVLRRYPRLGFKRGFHDMLLHELDSKQPYQHVHHACTLIAHRRAPMEMPDLQAVLNGAPFED
jgi:hypothetical protein